MAFFGVTYGGDYALLHRSQPANQDIAFASMTPDRFEELFALHKLGSSSTAACLQVLSWQAGTCSKGCQVHVEGGL